MKRLKNTTVENLLHENTGTNLVAEGYTIIDELILYRYNDTQLWNWFNDSSIIFNDGISDYSNKYEGWHRFFDYAFNTSFLSEPERTNGLTKKNVQEAIEEAKNSAPGFGRTCIQMGFNGNATVGRYLELVANVASNYSGFIIPFPMLLTDLSISVRDNSTVSVELYKNNIETGVILSLVNARKGKSNDLTVPYVALDEISAKVISGFGDRPMLYLFLR